MAENIEKGGGACGGGCAGHGSWHGKRFAMTLLAVAGAMYLFALFINTLEEHKYIGRDINAQTSISVTGDAEKYAAPDIATVSYSVTKEAKTVAEARKFVDENAKKIHAFLADSKVAAGDIKTTGYNVYPKYEWQQKQIVCIAYPCIQPEGKQVLLGYEVSQSEEVKIRDLDQAGAVLGGLTDNGATNVSGLNFLVEKEDGIKADVRKEAIDKAMAKAKELAAQLDVSLVRIVSFNEGGNYPVYYGNTLMKAMSSDAGMAASAPEVSAGENKYTSSVTIVYEIK